MSAARSAQQLAGHVVSDLPNIVPEAFKAIDPTALHAAMPAHRPRILLLYGSLRERSYSRLLTLEAARLLEAFGAETRIFDPTGLPLPDGAPVDHPEGPGASRSLALV